MHAALESQLGGAAGTVVLLSVLSFALSYFHPFRQRKVFLRYLSSVCNIVVLGALFETTLSIVPMVLAEKKKSGLVWISAVILVPLAIVLCVHQFSSLTRAMPDLKRQLLLSLSFNRGTILNGLIYFVPVVLLEAGVLLFFGYQYRNPTLSQVWNYMIIAPFVEEFFFRFLLPKLVSDDQCTERDYVVFSVIFACLHRLPGFIPIFIFSLYEYFLVEKTGSLSLAIAYHAISNFFCFAFSSPV